MKKYFILALFFYVAFLSSCSLSPINAKKKFAIKPTINYVSQKQKDVIMIEHKSCNSILNSTLFYYRKNKYEFEPYKTIGWIDPPCFMLQSDITDAIQKSGIFKLAENTGGFTPYNYKLTFSLNDLEPVFQKKSSYVLCNMNFFLFDSNNNLISSYSIKEREKLNNIKPDNVVKVMNKVVKKSILTMLDWLNRTVK